MKWRSAATPSRVSAGKFSLVGDPEHGNVLITYHCSEVHLAIRRLLDGPRPSRQAARSGEGQERCGLEVITDELVAATDNAEDEPKTLFGMLAEFMYVTPQVAALHMPSPRSFFPPSFRTLRLTFLLANDF